MGGFLHGYGTSRQVISELCLLRGSHLNQVNCENGPVACWQTVVIIFQSESVREGEREKEREEEKGERRRGMGWK